MKKNLLFIDRQVLDFDKSAGARTSYMYLNLFIEMGLSVTFIAADFRNNEPYARSMRSLGVKVLTGRWFQAAWRAWFMISGRQFDYVFFNRPFPMKHFISFVEKFTHAKILYQCHDLNFLRFRRQYEIDRDEKALEQSYTFEKLETELIRKSDVFLTFSQHEKDIIKEKLPHQHTEVIPLYFYENLPPPVIDFKKRHGILYVGGFMHKPNVDAVLWFVQEIFPEIKKHCPEIVFYVAGSHPPDEITAIISKDIKVLGYVTDEELAKLYRRVRLVVVPLRFGAGLKGKTVEAIHHSLPLVSTEIGIEGINLENIVPPVDSPKDFADRVVRLYTDESALRQCSIELHEYAMENLLKKAAKAKMGHILNSLNPQE